MTSYLIWFYWIIQTFLWFIVWICLRCRFKNSEFLRTQITLRNSYIISRNLTSLHNFISLPKYDKTNRKLLDWPQFRKLIAWVTIQKLRMTLIYWVDYKIHWVMNSNTSKSCYDFKVFATILICKFMTSLTTLTANKNYEAFSYFILTQEVIFYFSYN